ncbi:MAG: hypothetical protein Q9178_008074 [Gyalolechia marmorata]
MDDCGFHCIENAEYLSLRSPNGQLGLAGIAGNLLRKRYLEKTQELAIRSKHELELRRICHDSWSLDRFKRSRSFEDIENKRLKRRCTGEWKTPKEDLTVVPVSKWSEQCQKITDALKVGSSEPIENRKRAEHLLRMVYSVASKEVVNSWNSSSNVAPQNTPQASVAVAIYSMVNRGQSRSFYDNVVLRIGKYLLASRIVTRVEQLRRERSPSKQPVAVAGVTGEGNAVTRAFNEFVNELKEDFAQDIRDREIQKCKQWWNEGKVWIHLADAIDPAVLLFIPSGHESWDGQKIYDSEIHERRLFTDALIALRPDISDVLVTF